jgi:hypothetical protein
MMVVPLRAGNGLTHATLPPADRTDLSSNAAEANHELLACTEVRQFKTFPGDEQTPK